MSKASEGDDSSLIAHRSSLLPTRLIIDPPQSGVWNMAVDEALLESALSDGVATLRFYQWSEPTLSLGYFQKIADRELHPASRDCAVVRRRSGGGAIMHDHELTYSLTLPASSPQVREPEQVYRRAHEALVTALAKLLPTASGHLTADLCSAAIKPARGDEPFLCFLRRARCDVLLSGGSEASTVDGNHKVCGSAQRKQAGAVLQHGSLLLGRSPQAPELPGVADVLCWLPELDEVRSAWVAQIAKSLGLQLSTDQMNAEEQQKAATIANRRFGDPSWIRRR